MGNIIEVKSKDKSSYNIVIEKNMDKFIENLIMIYPTNAHKICIVTDKNVSKYHLEYLVGLLRDKFNHIITYEFEPGESQKTLSSISGLYEVLISENFHRNDFLIALGGGVVGDMTGFAAATFLRGIDFIQIPTTLLSQVDSSIGGKTGVDFNSYKNMIGAFYMPRLVYICTDMLKTLPKIEFYAGMAEVIKYGFIRNKSFLEFLFDNENGILEGESQLISNMIYESCLVKRDVVEEDPTEKGVRAILNFGHTIGHAIEKCSDFKLLHGECVAIGMVAAMNIAYERGLVQKEEVSTVKDVLLAYHLPVTTKGIDTKAVLEAVWSDKKMMHNNIKFILTKEIGDAYIETDVSADEIEKAIDSVVEQ